MAIRKINPLKLTKDYDLYPRGAGSLDSSHLAVLYSALMAGASFPPLIVEKKTNKIVDGFHRHEIYLRYIKNKQPENYTVDVEYRKYPTKKEFYLDAIRYNTKHGKNIEGSQRTNAIIKGYDLKINPKSLAAVLIMTVQDVEKAIETKVATVSKFTVINNISKEAIQPPSTGRRVVEEIERIPLKACVSHLRRDIPEGQPIVITSEQAAVIKEAPGQHQVEVFRHICRLIETDLVDTNNEEVMQLIKRLKSLLNKHF
jgi:hypothetical protein